MILSIFSAWQLVPQSILTMAKRSLTLAFKVYWGVVPLLIINQLLSLLLPLIFGLYLSIFLPYSSYRAQWVLELLGAHNLSPNLVLGGLFCMVLMKIWVEWIAKFQREMVAAEAVFHLQRWLYRGQLRIPYETHQSKGTGRYLLRWSGDLTSIKQLIAQGIIQAGADLFLFLIVVGATLVYIPWIGVALILIGIGILGMNGVAHFTLRPISTAYRNHRSRLLNHISQRLRALEFIQVFNRFQPEEKRFEKKLENVLARRKTFLWWREGIRSSGQGIFWLGLLVGVSLTIHTSDVDPSIFLSMILMLISLSSPFRRLLRVGVHLENGRISLEKLSKLMPIYNSDSSTPPLDLPSLRVDYLPLISLPQVDFSCYVEEPGIYTVVLPSETDIQGLMRNLVGTIPISEAHIYWNGVSVSGYDSYELRKLFSVVSHEFPLLGPTVFEAVSYSRKRIKRAEAQDLLDLVNPILPMGQRMQLDDRIGELGSKLNPSQRQLLGYVRMWMTAKPFGLVANPWYGLNSKQQLQLIDVMTQVVDNQQQRLILLDKGGTSWKKEGGMSPHLWVGSQPTFLKATVSR